MHPYVHATTSPEKAAIIMAETGRVVTYGELDQRSNKMAQLFRSVGLQAGDTVALLLENCADYLQIVWAAQRAGLYFATVSWRLQQDEIVHILANSQAKLIVTSLGHRQIAREAVGRLTGTKPEFLAAGCAEIPEEDLERRCAEMPSDPIPDQTAGSFLLYSSGTTGRPKGVRRLNTNTAIDAEDPQVVFCRDRCGVNDHSVYLSPAPLYHAAPLGWCMALHKIGGTVVVMERFDAEQALMLIEKYAVTHAQWVPTHFVRMLKLPSEVRGRYDVSSLQTVVHAAAPCPISVKEEMIEWWGPIIQEYYGGSEGNGLTFVTADEWIQRKGTVGRAVWGEVKVCDEEGDELPIGQEGKVYFAGGGAFEYVNDPVRTRAAKNRHGWTTLGDVGRLDEEGYLYLTDRADFLIISGGVNIYPQRTEDALITHPAVLDVAVVGAPHHDLGEVVAAAVELRQGVEPDGDLIQELKDRCRANLASFQVPRIIKFVDNLPRHPNGKLLKRLVKEQFFNEAEPADTHAQRNPWV